MSGYGHPSPGPLFDRVRPVSHRKDTTSKAAEAKLRESGALSNQCAETLARLVAYVEEHGTAPTVGELAGGDRLLQYHLARRLTDLASAGLIVTPQPKRVCRENGTLCLVWEPKP